MATFTLETKNLTDYSLDSVTGLAHWDDVDAPWDAELFTWSGTVGSWSNCVKNNAATGAFTVGYTFQDGTSYTFQDGTEYNFIEDAGVAGWTLETKN